MAYTQDQVDRLEAAIAEGAVRVRYADREVVYRDLEEMRQTLGMMKAGLAAAAGRPRRRIIIFRTSKGF